MIGRTSLVISTVLTSMGPPAAEPLEVVAVDVSAFPTVVVDIVAPVRQTAGPVAASMVEVDGAAVQSVAPIDPRDIVVGVVVDDRPTVPPAVVTQLQGAAVELVRNTRDRIQLSVGTPSGLRTALTSDRAASIARIAGITAGSPAVVPLSDVIVDVVTELASNPAGDRHAVVVLGGALEAADPALPGVAEALTTSGTVLHVVAPASVDPGALATIAKRSGGEVATAPEVLASVDGVTATISNRYRVIATVAGAGRHRVQLTVGGDRFAARFDVPAPESAPRPEPPAPSTTLPRVERDVSAATLPEPTVQPTRLDATQPVAGDEDALPGWLVPLGILALAAAALAAVVIVVVRRRSDETDGEVAVVVGRSAVAPKSQKPPTPPAPPPAPLPSRAARASPPGSPEPVEEAERPVRRAVDRMPRRSVRAVAAAPSPTQPDVGKDAPPWLVSGDLRMSRTLGEVWSGERKVALSPAELGVLELLITSGERGVTYEAIVAACELDESDSPGAVDAIVASMRRKAGIRGRGHAAVRKERVTTYFLDGGSGDPDV